MRPARSLLPLLLLACAGKKDEGPSPAQLERATSLVERLDGNFEEVVALGLAGPVVAASRPPGELPLRGLALVALGRIGGDEARDRLVEALGEVTRDPEVDGPMHLRAAAGLTLLADPGTAIDLIESLSTVNPNDYLGGRAAEEREAEYFPIDAQICEALLAMGLWNAEEELVRQMRRKDKIRVLIDAYAVLRRRTGLALPFRYNGSYSDRNADADAWLEALRASRDERRKKRPFDANAPRFRQRCAEVVGWLGGGQVRLRLTAHKILDLVGEHAVPILLDALSSENPVAQRQAAYVLGRIGARGAVAALREACSYRDPEAREQAVSALTMLADTGARALVRPLLGDDDAGVRTAAAAYLGRHGEAGDVASLREALRGESAPSTRTALLCALLRRGETGMVPDLVQVFVTGEQLDREAALAALEEVSGKTSETTALAPEDERQAAAERITRWFPGG